MKSSGFKTIKMRKKDRKGRRVVIQAGLTNEVVQRYEAHCELIENSHGSKFFDSVMAKLTGADLVAEALEKFRKLRNKMDKFKRLEEKAELYRINFNFLLINLCDRFIRWGYADDLQFNLFLRQESLLGSMKDILSDMQEDIAGIINPFEIFDAEIAEEKFLQYLVA